MATVWTPLVEPAGLKDMSHDHQQGWKMNNVLHTVNRQEHLKAEHIFRQQYPQKKYWDGDVDETSSLPSTSAGDESHDDDDAFESAGSSDEESSADDSKVVALRKSLISRRICQKAAQGAVKNMLKNEALKDIAEPPLDFDVLQKMSKSRKVFQEQTRENPSLLWEIFSWAQKIAGAVYEAMKQNIKDSLTNCMELQEQLKETESAVHHCTVLMHQMNDVIGTFLRCARDLKFEIGVIKKELSVMGSEQKAYKLAKKSDVFAMIFKLGMCKEKFDACKCMFVGDLERALENMEGNMAEMIRQHQEHKDQLEAEKKARDDRKELQRQSRPSWLTIPDGCKGPAFLALGAIGTVAGACALLVALSIAHVAVALCAIIYGSVLVIGGCASSIAYLVGCAEDKKNDEVREMLTKLTKCFTVLKSAMNTLKDMMASVQQVLEQTARALENELDKLKQSMAKTMVGLKLLPAFKDWRDSSWMDAAQMETLIEHFEGTEADQITASKLRKTGDCTIEVDVPLIIEKLDECEARLDELTLACKQHQQQISNAVIADMDQSKITPLEGAALSVVSAGKSVSKSVSDAAFSANQAVE